MNLAMFTKDMFEKMWSSFVFRAVVTGTSGNLVLIRRTGQTVADTQAYARLASYTPSVSDEVMVMWMGGFIVIGKITR